MARLHNHWLIRKDRTRVETCAFIGFKVYQWNMQRVSWSIISNLTRAQRARSQVGITWMRRASVTLPTLPPIVMCMWLCFYIIFYRQTSQTESVCNVLFAANQAGFWAVPALLYSFWPYIELCSIYWATNLLWCNAKWIITSVTLARLIHIIPTWLWALWALVKLEILPHPLKWPWSKE
jgi:hypothetical protein